MAPPRTQARERGGGASEKAGPPQPRVPGAPSAYKVLPSPQDLGPGGAGWPREGGPPRLSRGYLPRRGLRGAGPCASSPSSSSAGA